MSLSLRRELNSVWPLHNLGSESSVFSHVVVRFWHSLLSVPSGTSEIWPPWTPTDGCNSSCKWREFAHKGRVNRADLLQACEQRNQTWVWLQTSYEKLFIKCAYNIICEAIFTACKVFQLCLKELSQFTTAIVAMLNSATYCLFKKHLWK